MKVSTGKLHSLSIPSEVWIEVLKHLHYERSTLVQLSLVSRYLRSIAQPLLFHTLNDVAQMSKKTYRKYCRCGEKSHRHVLAYVREFTYDDECRHYKAWSRRTCSSWSAVKAKWFRSRRSQERGLYEALHPGALLPCMVNLTTLRIRTHDGDSLNSILRCCTQTFHLVNLNLELHKGSCELGEEELAPVVEAFIARQRGLRTLALDMSMVVMRFLEGEGVSGEIEDVKATWGQVVAMLSTRKSRLKAIRIINGTSFTSYSFSNPSSSARSSSTLSGDTSVTTMTETINPHHVPRLRYMFLGLEDLIALRLWEGPWKDRLVLLSVSSIGRPWLEIKPYLTPFSTLKILSITPTSRGPQIELDEAETQIQVRTLFSKMPDLELVFVLGGFMQVYVRRKRKSEGEEEDEVFELDCVKDWVKMCEVIVDIGVW